MRNRLENIAGAEAAGMHGRQVNSTEAVLRELSDFCAQSSFFRYD